MVALCLSMEKRKPTYDLAAIKARSGRRKRYPSPRRLCATRWALDSTVAASQRSSRPSRGTCSTYKSMTTHADHRVWQDVHHVPLENGPTLYVKFRSEERRVGKGGRSRWSPYH